jgi:hypothetical protein
VITLGQLTQFCAGLPCVGKRRFTDQTEADYRVAQLKRLQLDRPDEGVLHSYWCRRCGWWHIGHERPRLAWDKPTGTGRGDSDAKA